MLDGRRLDQALTVAADFIDLKSPYMGGHSRRCAQLATDAARVLGLPDDAITALRRAALVHDFGTTAVPNSIWDKPGPLTRTEFDRVELHPMLTEQMLRRSPALAALNPVASAHHEKCDGSGYHKRVRADTGDPAACVLAATEIYVGLTTERADRPPFSDADAAAELRRLEARRRARAARDPRRARRRRPRRAGGAHAQAAAEPGRAVPSRGRRAAPRGARAHHARRSRIGSSSRPRPPTTTSSTSTTRSASRPAPPPPSGRCSTTSSAERRAATRTPMGRSRNRDQRRNLTTGGQVRCCHRVRAVRPAAVPGRSESGSAAMNASTTCGSNWVAAWRRSSAIARAAGIARR